MTGVALFGGLLLFMLLRRVPLQLPKPVTRRLIPRLLILTPSKDGLPGQVLKDSPLY